MLTISIIQYRPAKHLSSSAHHRHCFPQLPPEDLCAMHSVQLLLKQPLHTGLNIMRPSCQRPFVSSLPPKKLSLSVQNPALRKFSVCLRCQFRLQSRAFSSKHGDDRFPRPEQQLADTHKFPRETNSVSAAVSDSQQDTQFPNPISRDTLKETNKIEEDNLPSESERRRSQLSKQFTEFMDTIQSNVFIAGQKLNDLTGYSGIEKLKQDIEAQGKMINGLTSFLDFAHLICCREPGA